MLRVTSWPAPLSIIGVSIAVGLAMPIHTASFWRWEFRLKLQTNQLKTAGTFLSDWDAEAVAEGKLKSAGTTFVYKSGLRAKPDNGREIAEELKDLFQFKKSVLPQIPNVPYVEEDVPMVCAWYPSAKSVLLWNLTYEKQEVTLHYKEERQKHVLTPLDTVRVKIGI